MKFLITMYMLVCFSVFCTAQNIASSIDKAAKILLQDPQMKHAIMGFCVVETNTGKIIYKLNEQVGLAPASTQKLFTSVAAFDILGNDYRFKTEAGYDGTVKDHVLNGNLFITGYGDPSFGSWRFAEMNRDTVLNKLIIALKKAGIEKVTGNIILDNSRFSYQPIPGGWIWDDIGNYYGAGTWAINWNENQYDLVLKPGNKEGDDVEIIKTDPQVAGLTFINEMKTGKEGSGDNGYIYLSPYILKGFTNGTVPAGEKRFIISGSLPNATQQFGDELTSKMKDSKIEFTGNVVINTKNDDINASHQMLYTCYSPTLDSLNYWFLQKSINLYGEAFAKTLAYEKAGFGSTEKGVAIIKDFWSSKGIQNNAINISDGSGLSPQNRVTADALVMVLQYAKDQTWYSLFYNALPTYDNIKMKSGTIGGVKAFAGYSTAANGTDYTFAIIINNYDSDAGSIVPKMYKVLDVLK